MIKKIVADNPENAGMHVLMGNFYFRQSKPDQAEAAYQKAIKIDSTNLRYQMILAGFYNTTGQKEKALASPLARRLP